MPQTTATRYANNAVIRFFRDRQPAIKTHGLRMPAPLLQDLLETPAGAYMGEAHHETGHRHVPAAFAQAHTAELQYLIRFIPAPAIGETRLGHITLPWAHAERTLAALATHYPGEPCLYLRSALAHAGLEHIYNYRPEYADIPVDSFTLEVSHLNAAHALTDDEKALWHLISSHGRTATADTSTLIPVTDTRTGARADLVRVETIYPATDPRAWQLNHNPATGALKHLTYGQPALTLA